MSSNELEFLQKHKFDKQIKKLTKKLKNKTVIIYGAGLLFQEVLKNYDISGLNVIGISDRKYSLHDEGSTDLGYKVIPLEKIKEYNPNYVLVATLRYISIMEDFIYSEFRGTKIRVLPLVDKPFFELIKEIFG